MKGFLLSVILGLCFVIDSVHSANRTCNGNTSTKPYPPTIKNTTIILQRLRVLMKTHGIDGYLILSADEHQTEYVAPWFKRRGFITGYTGSAGTAVVTVDKAAVWADGRYHDQLDMQVDCNWIIQKQGLKNVPPVSRWIQQELKGKVLGIDPRIIANKDFTAYDKIFGDSVTWKFIEKNLVDEVWDDRPSPTHDKLIIQPVQYAGQNHTSKIEALRHQLDKHATEAIIVQALDDVAWLLNLRGDDVPYVPFFYAYIIVMKNNVSLFVDPLKITNEIRAHLNSNDAKRNSYNVDFKDYNKIGDALEELANKTTGKIWVTPKASVYITNKIPKKQQYFSYSPIQLPKAMKNKVEIDGMKMANIKDGVAIMEYFVWLEEQIAAGNKVTELSGAKQLEKFKSEQKDYRGLSFNTISAFGTNGAIIHYRATNFTDAIITDKSLYLLDNGAQFPEGSTDITRTIHLGNPTELERERYTMVLQGAINLASVIFPDGTYGANIDAYARQYLWKVGLDYRHGTGHGIGHYLSIHEGPGRINQGRTDIADSTLREGMIFSDEPGFYITGSFGIRLETAVCVQPVKTKYEMDDKSFYGFEVITWVPFDRKLINVDQLEAKQISWLNKYYRDIRSIMGPEIKRQGKTKVYNYMMRETEPLQTATVSSAEKSCFSLITYVCIYMLYALFC